MEAPNLTPQCGDVLFTSSPGLERAVSLWVQRKVDPLAQVSERGFTHVAIAVNDGMALEAVPAPIEGDDIISRVAALKEAKDRITRTPWSDVELDFGVRPFPIEEICVKSLRPGCDLAVLRSTTAASEAAIQASDTPPHMKLLAVFTTVASREQAQSIATALVARKLVSCVQISEIESVYSWKGAVQHEPEFRLLLKTASDKYQVVESAIRELHAYELPAIFAIEVARAYEPYAAWVLEGSSGP